MTVRIGKMTFSDWVSLRFKDGWSDTFIFGVDARACIPPFEYAPLLKRMAAHVHNKRRGASLWVQVVGPGEWFGAELHRSLRGLRLPFAVTQSNTALDYMDFRLPPGLWDEPSKPPPIVAVQPSPLSWGELRCLQALCRMELGDGDEVASLAGLSMDTIHVQLDGLKAKGLVEHKANPQGEQDPACSSWQPSPQGLSLALRSWGVPRGVEFTSRKEKNLQDIGNPHRHLARLWPVWLKLAWPQAGVWAGWSEVGIPELSVIPDALAWGRLQGYETLFWLEVGDGHKSRAEITEVTATRLEQAVQFCASRGMKLVYTQLSTPWVHEAARWACTNLTEDVAVVLEDQKQFGRLPTAEWGRVAG